MKSIQTRLSHGGRAGPSQKWEVGKDRSLRVEPLGAGPHKHRGAGLRDSSLSLLPCLFPLLLRASSSRVTLWLTSLTVTLF